MHIQPYIVLGSAVVGLLVGLTGAGGGALMTPMLILLFGVQPSAAISSDLVAAVLMRPVGAAVHLRKGTVNMRLVGWMVLGSVPMAFAGAYLLHLLGGSAQQGHVEIALGSALLVGAGAMVLRYALDRRAGAGAGAPVPPPRRPARIFMIWVTCPHMVRVIDPDHGNALMFPRERVPLVPLIPSAPRAGRVTGPVRDHGDECGIGAHPCAPRAHRS
jgi:uncharacterized membrane protein YfcA